jgi:ferredoxin
VFVAGAALPPTRHAVVSVASGRAAAAAVCQYLAGGPVHGAARPWNVQMGRLEEAELAEFCREAPRRARVVPCSGEGAGYFEGEARAEAARCLQCACGALADCGLRRWAMAYEASAARYRAGRRRFERNLTHPSLVYEPGKCLACGLCVQIAEREREALGLTFVGRGFAVRVGVPFNESLAAGLARTARECAEACPTGALVWRG